MFADELRKIAETDGANYIKQEKDKSINEARNYFESIKPKMLQYARCGGRCFRINLDTILYPDVSSAPYIVKVLEENGFRTFDAYAIESYIDVAW